MRHLGTAWYVVKGLVEVDIVIALLHAVNSGFETMVIGSLVVIYAAVVGTFKMLGRSLVAVSHKQLEFLVELGGLLKHLNLEPYSAALEEVKMKTERADLRFRISVFFNSLVGLVGTLALLITALK